MKIQDTGLAYGKVRIMPVVPTITDLVPDEATPARKFDIPDVCLVHTIPSGEVRIRLPALPIPAATHCVPAQTTPPSPYHRRCPWAARSTLCGGQQPDFHRAQR